MFSGAIARAQEMGVRWSALAIEVHKEGPPGAEKLSLATLNLGTRVIALLHLPARFIVGFDEKASRVESFTDDRNTDLLQSPRQRASTRSGFQDYDTRASEDGKYISITMSAPGWPTTGASRLRIKGSVVALVASDEKQFEQKDASLRIGVDLKVGSLKYDTPRFGFRAEPILSYQGTRPLNSITLVDAAGNEIESLRMSRYRPARPGAAASFSTTFSQSRLPRAGVDRCTVRAVYFDTVQPVVVPLDLEIGLGL
jgi:hypothetical protein